MITKIDIKALSNLMDDTKKALYDWGKSDKDDWDNAYTAATRNFLTQLQSCIETE